MKKILFIIPYVPYPLDSGGNQAFFNMVDYIRHHYSVSLLLHPQNTKQERHVEDLKKVWNNVDFYVFSFARGEETKKVKPSLYYQWLKKIEASVSRKLKRLKLKEYNRGKEDYVREKSILSRSIFERFNSDYLEYVSQISRLGFDLIQVEFYKFVGLGYLLPENVQTLFVHHELMYIRNEKEISLFKKITAEDRMLFRVAKDFERDALLTYKHVIALSEIDRHLLIELLGREERIYCSPAVVRIEKSALKLEFAPAKDHHLTFVGSKAHFPNLDAVNWFCNEVAPYLRRKGYGFTLQVVGKWSGSSVRRLRANCPEIEFMGYVKNLHSFLNGSIFVVPIRIGSGIRMKILDAVFSEVPFVTTSKGIEGIDLRDNEECLIADDAESFAEAIIKLASQQDLQKKLVKQAKSRLQSLYNPQQMLKLRLDLYERILDE